MSSHSPPASAVRPAIRGYLLLIYICIGSLFALLGLKQFFLTAGTHPVTNTLWLLLQALPLLMLLPGLLSISGSSGRLTLFLTALAGLPYFVAGVWYAAAPESQLWGLWLTGFAVGLVALGSMGTRALMR